MIKTKIKKIDVITFMICFAFIPIEAINLVIGTSGYNVLIVFMCAYFLLIGSKDGVFRTSKQFLIWTILLIWMTLCTIINNQSIIYPIYYVGKVAFWFLINDWYIEKGSLRLLKMSRTFLDIVIIITVVQQYLAPGIFGYTEGMNARNFLVSDNFLGYYYTAYIAVCIILDFAEYRKTQPKTYFMVVLCFASILKAWAVKNIIGLAVIIIYILFIYRKKISRILNVRTLGIIFSLIFVGIVFFNIQERFMYLFSRYFNKDSTVSVRFYVWKQALLNIRTHPMFGFGIRKGQRLMLQQTWAGHARSSHNIILELLLEGGIIGLGIYCSSIIYAISKKRESIKGKYRYEYWFLLFVTFIFYVMELASGSIYYPFYYMPIILINNLDRIIDIKENTVKYVKKNMYRYKL